MALISINFFFIFFKCFIRSISTITSSVYEAPDEFDAIHKYRFVVFSVVDILNGVSILYAFYVMGLSSLSRKREASA
jgi:hypothetical protein